MSVFPQSSLTNRRLTTKDGFTLVELLVGMSLMIVIGLVLISMLHHSAALVSQGTAMIATHQKSRSVIDRVGPYVATAVPGPTKAIITPEQAKSNIGSDPDLLDDRVQFTTTEDFLRTTPPYDPTDGGIDEFWDPTSDGYHIYQIVFVPDGTGLGRVELQKMSDPGIVDATVAPRVLGHRILAFRTALLSGNALEIQVETSTQRRGPNQNMIDVIESESAVIAIPQGSYL